MYSRDERDRRWNLARGLMRSEGVSALIAYGDQPAAYFTGGIPHAIAILPAWGEPIALAPHPRADGWMPSRAAQHAYGIADALTELRLDQDAVGVLGLEPHPPTHGGDLIPYTLWTEVLRLLPSAAFRSVWPAYVRFFMPQSEAEREVLVAVGRAARTVAAALTGAPGANEDKRRAAGLAAGTEAGATTQIHITGNAAHITCRLRDREVRLVAPLGLGPVAELGLARRAYAAGLRALRPGTVFGRVDDAMRTTLPDPPAQPLIAGLNPSGAVGAARGHPPVGYDLPIKPHMTFALLGSYGSATVGGTVLTTEHDPIEI